MKTAKFWLTFWQRWALASEKQRKQTKTRPRCLLFHFWIIKDGLFSFWIIMDFMGVIYTNKSILGEFFGGLRALMTSFAKEVKTVKKQATWTLPSCQGHQQRVLYPFELLWWTQEDAKAGNKAVKSQILEENIIFMDWKGVFSTIFGEKDTLG